MKRYSGLHDKLCTIENIEVADDNARKNTQKHNELVDTVNELKAKVETYSDKINELEERVHQLENASQS